MRHNYKKLLEQLLDKHFYFERYEMNLAWAHTEDEDQLKYLSDNRAFVVQLTAIKHAIDAKRLDKHRVTLRRKAGKEDKKR